MKYITINGRRIKDISGIKYNHLTAIRYNHSDLNNHSYWLFRCDCGNEKIISSNSVTKKNAETKSCGCLNNKVRLSGNNHRSHGKCNDRLYKVWLSMRRRCNNKNNDSYKRWYGAKGITVCPEWNNFTNFEKWARENGYDENADYMQCTLDRIDFLKGYSPDNCRWVNATTQARNRRNNRLINWNNESHTAAEWAELTGISSSAIKARIYHYGWSIDKALTTPSRTRRKEEK